MIVVSTNIKKIAINEEGILIPPIIEFLDNLKFNCRIHLIVIISSMIMILFNNFTGEKLLVNITQQQHMMVSFAFLDKFNFWQCFYFKMTLAFFSHT